MRRLVFTGIVGLLFAIVASCLPEDPGPTSHDAGNEAASVDAPSGDAADSATDGGTDGPASPFSFFASLDGQQGARANGHSGSGTFEGFFVTGTSRFCGTVRPVSTVGIAHIHDGDAGSTGSVIATDNDLDAGVYEFDVTLSGAQRVRLENAGLYVDIHVSGPTGIRGQIVRGGTKTSCP